MELAAAAAVRRLHGSNDSNDYELVTSPRCEIVNSDVVKASVMAETRINLYYSD